MYALPVSHRLKGADLHHRATTGVRLGQTTEPIAALRRPVVINTTEIEGDPGARQRRLRLLSLAVNAADPQLVFLTRAIKVITNIGTATDHCARDHPTGAFDTEGAIQGQAKGLLRVCGNASLLMLQLARCQRQNMVPQRFNPLAIAGRNAKHTGGLEGKLTEQSLTLCNHFIDAGPLHQVTLGKHQCQALKRQHG
ncbi:hypothetical protein WKR14_02420 [Shewanella chilikensis]|nr:MULTISPECIES: hypothetical protein [Shewanella]MCE9850862.1 hypothetical protein [Shewanella chilikensis]